MVGGVDSRAASDRNIAADLVVKLQIELENGKKKPKEETTTGKIWERYRNAKKKQMFLRALLGLGEKELDDTNNHSEARAEKKVSN